MTLITQLEFEIDFTESEKQIARYILSNTHQVLTMSIKELAHETYSSPATIVRLCKRLGVSGFHEFKIIFSGEIENRYKNDFDLNVNIPFQSLDNEEEIMNKLYQIQKSSLKETMNLIDHQKLKQVVNLILNSDCINIYGTGDSLYAGLEFEAKLLRIGLNCHCYPLEGTGIFSTLSVSKNTVNIVISYSGETGEIIRTERILKQKGSKIISMTSLGHNTIASLADINLYVDSRETMFNKIACFSSFESTNYLLNYIYSLVFWSFVINIMKI